MSMITYVYYFKIPLYTISMWAIFNLKGEILIMIYFSQYIFVGYVPPVPRNLSDIECNESSSTARCQWTIGKQAV